MIPDLDLLPPRVPRAPRSLDATVGDLLALGMVAKHSHWNVVGVRFTPLHALFDGLASYLAEAADRVAERLRALGLPVDGRPGTLSRSPVPEPPRGVLRDDDAIARGIAAVEWVARRVRERLDEADLEDAVSRDLVVGILERLNHYAWMLRAQT